MRRKDAISRAIVPRVKNGDNFSASRDIVHTNCQKGQRITFGKFLARPNEWSIAPIVCDCLKRYWLVIIRSGDILCTVRTRRRVMPATTRFVHFPGRGIIENFSKVGKQKRWKELSMFLYFHIFSSLHPPTRRRHMFDDRNKYVSFHTIGIYRLPTYSYSTRFTLSSHPKIACTLFDTLRWKFVYSRDWAMNAYVLI